MGGDHWDAPPDIIALSKGFGAGYLPLGAMIANGKIVDAVLDNGEFVHGFTYAGNLLACASGLTVINQIDAKNMTQNAAKMGALLKNKLTGLMMRYPFIGDVRGKGLLLAFELVADHADMTPLHEDLNAFDRLVYIAYKN